MKTRRVLRESDKTLAEGFGPSVQRDYCEKFEKEHSLQMVKEHLSVESSSTWKRDELEAIIEEAIREKDEIPCVEFSRANRFARNQEAAGYYYGLLRKHGLVVGFAYDDLLVDDGASVRTKRAPYEEFYQAEKDGNIMRDSMLGGRDKLAKEAGQVPNGSVKWPFDYHPKRIYGQMTTGRPSVNEGRAEWVKRWSKSVLEEGIGVNGIEEWMDKEGVRTKRGKKLTAAIINHILRSKQLVGEFRWKGQLYLKDESLRILPDEEYEALQQRLDENRAKSYYNAVKWDYPPLPDVFHKCGERVKRVPLAARNGKKVAYYRCPKCKGPGRCIQAQPVWESLRPRLESELLRAERLIPALRAEFASKDAIRRQEQDIKAKEAQIRKCEEQKDAAFELGVTLKNYPMERVQQKIDKAEADIQRLNDEKSLLEKQLSALKEQQLNDEGIRRLCQLVEGNLANLTKEQWGLLLKRLGLRVIIHSKDEITVRVALPPIREGEIEFSRFLSANALDKAFTSVAL